MDDWDTVTKIGKSVNRGGGGPRESIVRGKSAINAAHRSGAIVGTEKKFTTGNLSTKSGPDGQKLAKIDRTDDTGKIDVLPLNVRQAMEKARTAMKDANDKSLSQAALANKCSLPFKLITDIELGKVMPSQQELAKIENVLNVKLRGKDVGKPKFAKRA